MTPPLLEMRGIRKSFPGVVALDHVHLEVFSGEVVGLIGENGAGKSTLMKVLGGIYAPDAGEILIEGEPVEVRSPAQANRLGIGFVHQEPSVLDNLDVAANVFLGREPLRGGPLRLIDRGRIESDTRVVLERLALDIPPRALVSTLSMAQRQMIEIARVLSMEARLIILDEPTSSLTLSETHRLMEVIRSLREEGISFIFITHRLAEVKDCADRVVALRDGANSGALQRDEIDHDRMVSLMVGRALKVEPRPVFRAGRPVCLEVRELRTRSRPRCAVSFDVAQGEILGIAGLVGSGRTEVARALFGVERPLDGEVRINGRPVDIHSARDAIDCGLYLVPEDRRESGLVVEMTVRENVTLASVVRHARAYMVSRASESQVARRQVESLRIKTPSVESPVANLSGGNQQKVILGRWLSMEPRVLIFDEPTRGIDVGAKQEIYNQIRALAGNGTAIVMISSDLEEVLGVSDRIAVMHEGFISGFLEREEFSEEAVMHLAVAGRPKTPLAGPLPPGGNPS